MSDKSIINVSEYVAPLRRWFLVVLIATVVGALIGFALFQFGSEEFTAEAKVQIKPIVVQNADPNLDSNRQVNTVNEEQIASSERVAERAASLIEKSDQENAATFSAETIEEARDHTPESSKVEQVITKTSVELVPDSQILVFSATSNDAELSKQLAQAVAVAYLDFRQAEAVTDREEASESLLEREKDLVLELKEIYEAQPAAVAADGEVSGPDNYLVVAKEQELSFIGQIKATLRSGTVDAGTLITDARLPSEKGGLPSFAGVVLGGLIGLMIGSTLVYAIDRQDDRLRSASTELAALGTLVLGTAPASRKSKQGISIFANNTAGGDAYRRVHGTLLFNLDKENRSMILVAGVKSSGSSRCVAANIAASAARSGRKTLLVGADLRDNKLHDGLGLSDVVSGQASLSKTIDTLDYIDPNLDILGAGTVTTKPANILQSDSFGRLLSAVKADYDLVLVEAPGILDVADAMDIARFCDGALIVVENESESRQSIAESISQVKNIGSEIVGVVVTEKD